MKNTKITGKRTYSEAEFKEFEPRLKEGEKEVMTKQYFR